MYLFIFFRLGYVTLPRKLTRGPIDWSAMTERPPIYDGVGPRTSALGNSDMVKPSMSSEAVVSMASTASANSKSRTTKLPSSGITSQQKRTSSLKRFPENTTNSTAGNRDSSASEVTLTGDTDSLTAYIEPFGRATLPQPLMSCRPDSIASATDSDLEAILSREDTGGPSLCHDVTKRGAIAVGSSNRGKSSNITNSVTSASGGQSSCPLHTKSNNVMLGPKIIAIPRDTSKHVVQLTKGPKQLKGILKMPAKNNITTNPVESLGLGLPPVPPPPPSATTSMMSQQAKNCRETSTSSSGSSGGSPPALEKATNDLINDLSGVHISLSSKPKPPLRTSSSMNSKNGVSEALHV